MKVEKSVAVFLELIEAEKRKPKPDKAQMREWLKQIQKLRYEDDYRETYTDQNCRFLVHTSMRTFRDDN